MNDWLRGERDWRDLMEVVEQLPSGSRYQAARLRDPAVVEYLAEQDDEGSSAAPSLESWNPMREQLATITDVLLSILYATAHDESTPPVSPRPEYPHMLRRQEIRREGLRELDMILVPYEFEEGGDARG